MEHLTPKEHIEGITGRGKYRASYLCEWLVVGGWGEIKNSNVTKSYKGWKIAESHDRSTA